MGISKWFLLVNVQVALCCKINIKMWRNRSVEERVNRSAIVLYGTDVEHVNRSTDTDLHYATDSRFLVHCILKNDGEDIMQNIIIDRIHPRITCSVSSLLMGVGRKVILLLKRTERGNYEYDQENTIQSASFPATKEYFDRVASVCGSSNWIPPKNSTKNECLLSPNTTKYVCFDENAGDDTNISSQFIGSCSKCIMGILITLICLLLVN